MKELTFDEAVKGSQPPGAPEGPYDRGVVALVEPPELSGRVVRVRALLRNNRSVPARVCLHVPAIVVTPPNDSRVRFTGALRPAPAPPPPAILELPAESAVRLEGTCDLAEWQWEGSVEVELGWAISFFAGPTICAGFRLQLR